MRKRASMAALMAMGLGLVCLPAGGQALPASVPGGGGARRSSGLGFQMPAVGGSFRYSVSASQTLSTGLYGNTGVLASTNFSGNAAILTESTSHPLSLIYSGGYLRGNSGQQSPFFQNLAFSQAVTIKRWSVVVSDAVNYLPETPTTGLSGVPGVGDQDANPVVVGGPAGLGVLTNYGTRVTNSLSGSVTRSMTGRLSLEGSGTYTILRYLGGTGTGTNDGSANGLDNSSYGGSGGFSYRVDARSNAGGSYNYSQSSYGGSNFTFTTQAVNVSYSRQMTRRLSVNVSGGPLKVHSTYASLSGPSVNLAANAGLSYTTKEFTTTLSYVRGTSSGSGVVPGALSDSVLGDAHRSLGRDWRVSGSLGYARTKGLQSATPFLSEGVTASGQVSRSIGRRVSAYASYTIADQTLQGSGAALNALSGIYQVAGFGLTYSPGLIHFGPR